MHIQEALETRRRITYPGSAAIFQAADAYGEPHIMSWNAVNGVFSTTSRYHHFTANEILRKDWEFADKMTLSEAMQSGKPFAHPDMIGAFMLVDDALVHRDNVRDFDDLSWIRSQYITRGNPYLGVGFLTTEDLCRKDWYTIEREKQ